MWTTSYQYHAECDHCGQRVLIGYGEDATATADRHERENPGHDVWAIQPEPLHTLDVWLPR